MNELESLKKKIKYRSAYRGTKEMDLLLTTFVLNIIDTLSYEELKKLDSNSVDLIVADPPYFRVRFYVHLL